MTKGLLVKEKMSGWFELSSDISDQGRIDFQFEIEAFTPKLMSLTTPRDFLGIATVGIDNNIPIGGTLTIHLTGPEYDFWMRHPELGEIHIQGKKQYKIPRLIYSMTHCDMTIRKDGKIIGKAQLAYRDSVIAFPFRALSIVDAPEWFTA